MSTDFDAVVCMPIGPSPWRDNEHGICSRCGRPIMFRPHAPKAPPKICIFCAVKWLEKEKGGRPKADRR